MARHWVNRYKREPKPRQFRHHTTYLTTPADWLGPKFFDEAEVLKQRDPIAYAHEYLGEVVGCGTQVFDNLEIREISREEISQFDRTYCGLDWGWYPDPNHFGEMAYSSPKRTLYILPSTAPPAKRMKTWPAFWNRGRTRKSLLTAQATKALQPCGTWAFAVCAAAISTAPMAVPA